VVRHLLWGLLHTHPLLLIAHPPNLLYIKISLKKINLSKIGFNSIKEKDLLYNLDILLKSFWKLLTALFSFLWKIGVLKREEILK